MANTASPETVTISDETGERVSGLLQMPPNTGSRGAAALACYVMAHGAGAGMTHPFMASVADGLAERGIATLRYQFPYMERGSKRTDAPKLAQATVRGAVAEASRRVPTLPLIAGGKSFGGRMTSQAQAASPLPGVRGLVFLGFPLHPAGRASNERADHLDKVSIPMLFLQGTRDELAELTLLQAVIEHLKNHATLKLLDSADHSFHVLARSGRKDADVRAEMLDAIASWITSIV